MPEANVGMLFDDATHAADWFLWTFGVPISVVAEIDNVVTNVPPMTMVSRSIDLRME